jgi:hypothetical protein
MFISIGVLTMFDSRSSREGQTRERSEGAFVADPSAGKPSVRVLKNENRWSTPLEPTVEPKQQVVAAPQSAPSEVVPTPAENDRFRKLTALAESRRKEGRLHDSLALYQRALEVEAGDIPVMLEVADLLFELDRSQEALDVLGRVKKLDPSDARPYLSSGTIFLMRNQPEQAKDAYRIYLAMAQVTPETRPRITEVKRILQNLETRK